MKMVLASLPNIVARIGRVSKVLDFGAGPTIHVAASFRNSASEVTTAVVLENFSKQSDSLGIKCIKIVRKPVNASTTYTQLTVFISKVNEKSGADFIKSHQSKGFFEQEGSSS